MQQDKFQQAANLIVQNQEQGSPNNAGRRTPKKVCKCSSANVSQSTATPRLLSKLVNRNSVTGAQIFRELCMNSNRQSFKEVITKL